MSLNITIKKRPRRRSGASERRGPIVPEASKKRPTRRRLKPQGIKFYDIGQVKSGNVWQYNPYSIAPPIDDFYDFSQADISASVSQLALQSNEELRTKYRPMTASILFWFNSSVVITSQDSSQEFYSLQSGSTDWDDSKGLTIPPDKLSQLSSMIEIDYHGGDPIFTTGYSGMSLSFNPEVLQDPTHFATATHDFDGARIPYRLGISDEIFMAPTFAAYSKRTSGRDTDNTEFYGFEYRYTPRNPNDLSLEFNREYDKLLDPSDINSLVKLTAELNYMPSLPGIRGDYFDFMNVFAEPDSVTTRSGPGYAFGFVHLLAIVLRGSQRWYIWKDLR